MGWGGVGWGGVGWGGVGWRWQAVFSWLALYLGIMQRQVLMLLVAYAGVAGAGCLQVPIPSPTTPTPRHLCLWNITAGQTQVWACRLRQALLIQGSVPQLAPHARTLSPLSPPPPHPRGDLQLRAGAASLQRPGPAQRPAQQARAACTSCCSPAPAAAAPTATSGTGATAARQARRQRRCQTSASPAPACVPTAAHPCKPGPRRQRSHHHQRWCPLSERPRHPRERPRHQRAARLRGSDRQLPSTAAAAAPGTACATQTASTRGQGSYLPSKKHKTVALSEAACGLHDAPGALHCM